MSTATENSGTLTQRRQVIRALTGVAMLGSASPARVFAQGKPFKVALMIPLSGPASLFGPTDKACAELAVARINASGGVLGRQVQLLTADAGGAPADTTKEVVRLMLNEKVDAFVGSHDSATREAVLATIKGRSPYIYTPVYEGGECSPNTFCLGETPPQQVQPAAEWLIKEKGAKSFFLIGNDYVWPRRTNEQVKKYVAQYGGTVLAEEYVPFGAPNKFEEVVTRIKAAKPDVVIITLVGGDNVNFNRTFAGFGLDKETKRLALLLEENTLMGVGAESSAGLYSCMGYFANEPSSANTSFKQAYAARFGEKAPQLSTLGVDCYAGLNFAKALFDKAGSSDARKLMAASEGLSFETAAGRATMIGRAVDKDMFLAECKGTSFEVVKRFAMVKSGTACRIG